jgi:hypothetical protein
MYAIIRHYRAAAPIDELMHRVDTEFADRVPAEIDALLYQAIDTGDGTAMTVTLVADDQAADRADAAAARVRTGLADLNVEVLDVFRGKVMVSRAAERVLEPVHY